MTHRHNLEAVNQTLQDIVRSTLPSCGIAVLFIENFTHILPVGRAANWSQIASICFILSPLFPLFKRLKLD